MVPGPTRAALQPSPDRPVTTCSTAPAFYTSQMSSQGFTLPIVLLICGIASAAPAHAETGYVRYVTDGDTFRLTTGERIRIANIDAPEIHARQAKCRLEIERGEAATKRARALLDGKAVTIERVGRSYNRTVARVRVDGRDLGEALIASGAARPWLRHQPKPDWCG